MAAAPPTGAPPGARTPVNTDDGGPKPPPDPPPTPTPSLKNLATEIWLSQTTATLDTIWQLERLLFGVGDHVLGRRGASADYAAAIGEASSASHLHLRGLLAAQVRLGKKISHAHRTALSNAVGRFLRRLQILDPLDPEPASPTGGVEAVLGKLARKRVEHAARRPPPEERAAPIQVEVRCAPGKGGEATFSLTHARAGDVTVTFNYGTFVRLPADDGAVERDHRVRAKLEFEPPELTLRPRAVEQVKVIVPWDERLQAGRRYHCSAVALGVGQRIDLWIDVGAARRGHVS